jgi:hypothetical protein
LPSFAVEVLPSPPSWGELVINFTNLDFQSKTDDLTLHGYSTLNNSSLLRCV